MQEIANQNIEASKSEVTEAEAPKHIMQEHIMYDFFQTYVNMMNAAYGGKNVQ